MVVLSLVVSIIYKAFNNESSLTLVSLVFLKWCWATLICASFAWHPKYFKCHILILLDVTQSIDVYLWGIINMVVFLQWVQVYRVVTSLHAAESTIARNWAIKM